MTTTILIIDNHEEMRTILRRYYELLLPDATIYEAQNGLEGLALATQHIPDLILLDGSMPIMNGGEAAPLLRQHPKTANIPIIGVSAEIGGSEIHAKLHQYCSAFVAKPASLETIQTLTERFVDSAKNLFTDNANA